MFALDSAHGPGTPFVYLSTSSPHDLFSVRESLILTIKYRMLREGETNTVHPFLLLFLMPSSRGGIYNRILCSDSARRVSFSPTSPHPGW